MILPSAGEGRLWGDLMSGVPNCGEGWLWVGSEPGAPVRLLISLNQLIGQKSGVWCVHHEARLKENSVSGGAVG